MSNFKTPNKMVIEDKNKPKLPNVFLYDVINFNGPRLVFRLGGDEYMSKVMFLA